MTEAVPGWAEAAMSAELPLIAASGERQEVEFKAELPKQVSDLAKEIAGFATSNPGRILIGIGDDGTIVGLADCAERAWACRACRADRGDLRQRGAPGDHAKSAFRGRRRPGRRGDRYS